MSMHEALARLPGVKWLRRPDEELPPPAGPTLVEEMTEWVRIAAGPKGAVEKVSATWIAVSHWAANELLSCLVELQSASDERAAALRSRAKTLRELLALPEEREQPKFAEHDPHIP